MKQIVMYSPANFSLQKTGEFSSKARHMTVLDYGFLAVVSEFRVLDSSLFLWNLDSGFQSLAGFRIPCIVSGFQSPGFRIPQANFSGIQDPTSKNLPDSGIRIPINGAIRPMKGYSSEQGSRVGGTSNQLYGGGSLFFWLGVFVCCCCCFIFAIKLRSGLEFRDHLVHELNSCATNISKISFNPIYPIKHRPR